MPARLCSSCSKVSTDVDLRISDDLLCNACEEERLTAFKELYPDHPITRSSAQVSTAVPSAMNKEHAITNTGPAISPTKLVCDELLCFIFNSAENSPSDDIRSTVLSFYCDDAVSDAKRLLWEHYEFLLPAWEGRRSTNKKSLREKEIDDILKAIKLIDSKIPTNALPVTFVAVRLSNIPLMNKPCDKPADASTPDLNARMMKLEQQMDILVTNSAPLPGVNRTKIVPPSRPKLYATAASVNIPNVPCEQSQPVTTSKGTAATRYEKLVVKLPPVSTRPTESKLSDDNTAGFAFQRKKARRRPQAVYGTRSPTATLKSGPVRQELFLFRVHHDITTEDITSFLNDQSIKLTDIEKLSKSGSWTDYYRVVIEARDLGTIMTPDFWPDGIGCRRFWRKRGQNNG